MTYCEWTAKHDVDNDEKVIVVKMEEIIMKKDMIYKGKAEKLKRQSTSLTLILTSLLKCIMSTGKILMSSNIK